MPQEHAKQLIKDALTSSQEERIVYLERELKTWQEKRRNSVHSIRRGHA